MYDYICHYSMQQLLMVKSLGQFGLNQSLGDRCRDINEERDKQDIANLIEVKSIW